jgi:uncharacterized cupin superfamily protein
MPNIYDCDYDEPREHPGFRVKRARLGHQLGTVRVGISVWELPPGEAAYPYHFHLGEEEVVLVLQGRPALRTPAGWRRVERGEALAFGVGEEGAHQLVNDTDEPVRIVAISSQGTADVVIYPDQGLIGAADRRLHGTGLRKSFRLADEVDYNQGLTPPEVGDVDPA